MTVVGLEPLNIGLKVKGFTTELTVHDYALSKSVHNRKWSLCLDERHSVECHGATVTLISKESGQHRSIIKDATVWRHWYTEENKTTFFFKMLWTSYPKNK